MDATEENHRMGRLINHGRKLANLSPQVVVLNEQPNLCFFASRDILADEELFYDYGERRTPSLKIILG